MTAICISPETAGWDRKWETGRCRGETSRSVFAKVRDDIFARFHEVAAKLRSRTQEFTVWHDGTGASRYDNRCIDGGNSPEYFGYHHVYNTARSMPWNTQTTMRLNGPLQFTVLMNRLRCGSWTRSYLLRHISRSKAVVVGSHLYTASLNKQWHIGCT
jgi:hypothetical protein